MWAMSALKDMHAGRPAAILGGGPSLPADMLKLPKDCVLIAVNYHAFYHCLPHYMVYNDHPASDPELLAEVKRGRAIRVSPDQTSDIRFDVDVWTGFYSSNTAAWLALWMGCNPVILCGCDCYQGEQVYCHPTERDAPTFHYPLDHHLRPWQEEARARCPHPERLTAMSGPLSNIFGLYETLAIQIPG